MNLAIKRIPDVLWIRLYQVGNSPSWTVLFSEPHRQGTIERVEIASQHLSQFDCDSGSWEGSRQRSRHGGFQHLLLCITWFLVGIVREVIGRFAEIIRTADRNSGCSRKGSRRYKTAEVHVRQLTHSCCL